MRCGIITPLARRPLNNSNGEVNSMNHMIQATLAGLFLTVVASACGDDGYVQSVELNERDAGIPDGYDATSIPTANVDSGFIVEADASPGMDAMPGTPTDMEVPEPPPEDAPNRGWIGGPCAEDSDCTYDNGYCLRSDEGFPGGLCSLDCEQFCPDRDAMPVTFCVGGLSAGSGACVQRCDYQYFPVTGCRVGYVCTEENRFGQPEVARGVCLPGEPGDVPEPVDSPCYDEVAERGMRFERQAPISDAPENRPDLRCSMEGPLLLSSPVAGIDYRYVSHEESRPILMSCRLAIALDRLGELLTEFDVVEVGHIGTYNCREISGTDSLSMHGLGLAIDLKWFRTSNGRVYDVEDDWEHGVTRNFATEEGEFLYRIAWQMHTRRIFNIILTPEFNAAHDNHFHVDLTPGSNFIQSTTGRLYFGPNGTGE